MKGVAQTAASYQTALKTCGTMDKNGNTIGMVDVEWTGLRWIPLGLRLAGLLFLIVMFSVKHPLGFLPGDKLGWGWMIALEHWELFSTGTWLLAIGLYVIYFVTSIIKGGLFRGVPGVEIQFARYGKIVETLRPGKFANIFDPRVQPRSVISTKPMVLDLNPVENFTQENIKMTARGALVFRVTDSLLLLQQGGFDGFFNQMQSVFASAQQDRIQRSSARQFNRYMIEPAEYPVDSGVEKSIDERLGDIEKSNLTVDMLMKCSEIGELDVSKFKLDEPAECARRSILSALASDAKRFGIEVLDYVPQGNLTDSDYFQTLATPLVQSIQRLRQAASILKDILRQEIDEEITARVAHKQRGLLEIKRLCSEVTSVIETLRQESNRTAIVEATGSSMESKVRGMLAEYLANIEALTAKARADQIDTAGLEKYVAEYERLLTTLATEIEPYLPHIDTVVLEKLSADALMPDIDIIDRLMKQSGLDKELEKLITAVEKEKGANGELEQAAATIARAADDLDADELMKTIQKTLGEISPNTGIDTTRFTPERVGVKIDEIERTIADAEGTQVISMVRSAS